VFLSPYTPYTVLDDSPYAAITLPPTLLSPLSSQFLATGLFHNSSNVSIASRRSICPSTVLGVYRSNTPIHDAFQSSLWFRMGSISITPTFDPRVCDYIQEYLGGYKNPAHEYLHSQSTLPQVFATEDSDPT